jgi:3-methyladenine DNA glycosylase AlkC
MDEIIKNIFETDKDDAEKALKILLDCGQIDGAHHKAWVIDQAVRALAGPYYDELIASYKDNGEYEWDEGIAP